MVFSTNSGDSSECKQTENALLRESEGMFRRLVNYAPVLTWMSDTSKRCTWFNETWLSYTGRSTRGPRSRLSFLL